MFLESVWFYLVVGYVLTVTVELPILVVGLGAEHSLRRKLAAGFWLTACTYPGGGAGLTALALEPLLGFAVALPGRRRVVRGPRRMRAVPGGISTGSRNATWSPSCSPTYPRSPWARSWAAWAGGDQTSQPARQAKGQKDNPKNRKNANEKPERASMAKPENFERAWAATPPGRA